MRTAIKSKTNKTDNEISTITLTYKKSAQAKKTLDFILSLGIFSIPKKRSPIDEGLDDIRNGRVYTISNPANIIEECLQ
ncbi:MAG: hypothetical protein LBS80_06880 [Tannerella sp.]|jgi:hypothetical protein|nr:hypothetical protein [Tannerella sp.]